MESRHGLKSAIRVQEGIDSPPNINPDILKRIERRGRKKYSVENYFEGILSGNITILSQAITLVESSLYEHIEPAQSIIEKCLPYSSGSVRIGITGVPGVGKSTFIESFGKLFTSQGRKVAVLAIDPSSGQTGGSILGDKTRMEQLGTDPLAFVRPSPSAGTLGGVARKTRETIILCEAAGFNTILVETVGVGQSETAVHSMVDYFLLLLLAGAGDQLQGIKRGIMEMADGLVITKADGNNKTIAECARTDYQTALNLFPPVPSGWKPKVMTCSAREKTGIKDIWEEINAYISFTKSNGYFDERRKQQSVVRMHCTISEQLENSFYNLEEIKLIRPGLEKQLYEGKITAYKAASVMLGKYFNKK
jgi:LAO/AO transport system kinase